MEFLKNNARGIVVSLLVAGAIIGIASLSNDSTDTVTTNEAAQSEEAEQNDDTVNGQANENDESADQEKQEAEAESQPTVDISDNGFVSTAVQGDNQTVVVRRIVDTYLSNNETQLSEEQKLYVETNLVNDIGRSNFIVVAEKISLSKETVSQRVEEAKNLSEAAIARWSAYL